MYHQRGLLFNGFNGNKPHVGPVDRLTNCLGIVGWKCTIRHIRLVMRRFGGESWHIYFNYLFG